MKPQKAFWVTGLNPADQKTIAICVQGGLIQKIEPTEQASTDWVCRGLIDLQVNGFGGLDLNADQLTADLVVNLSELLLKNGVTCFLPTLITAAEEQIIAALKTIHQARQQYPLLQHLIPYVHVEGPHISPSDGPCGAHPKAFVRPPDLAEFERWQKACAGLVGMVTLSPHYVEAPNYIQALVKQGVHVALGHSHASPEQIKAAVKAGARLSTHLGNGVAANLPRHPNLIWNQLAEDNLVATLIADGHHLSTDTIRVMLRAKGLERSILVSDTVAVGGCSPGIYDQPIGGQVELTADGKLSIVGTAYLAGAASPLKDGVARVANLGYDLVDALRLATENPAKWVHKNKGLAVGQTADIVLFRWQKGAETLAITQSLLKGESCLK